MVNNKQILSILRKRRHNNRIKEKTMRWKKLFTPVENLEAQDARAYIKEHQAGTFTLLDVRQPAEYEESHIAGAKLVPLPQLTERLNELDPDRPMIVYCAIGGRSRAAAQLLAGKGFDTVYNLKGGIKAWEGKTAFGPVELGEIHLRGDETVKEILVFIYSMESGLERFYQKTSAAASDAPVAGLLKKLAGIETTHKERLYRLFVDLDSKPADRSRFESDVTVALMEGGFDIETFLSQNQEVMQTTAGVLDIAMMLETQGLDLYLRYAQQAREGAERQVLYDIAEEEKAHLAALGRLMEETVS
jgi:sulfur-carrier protein adenylyltransferase/sulfurtransferase